MDKVFLHILNASINASWIVLTVILLRLVLRRAPKWTNCVLWGLVAVRLLVPITLESSLSLIPRAEIVPTALVEDMHYKETESDIVNDGGGYIDITEGEYVNVTQEKNTVNTVTLVVKIASIVWSVGVLIMFLYWIVSYIRFTKRMRTATLYESAEYGTLRIKQSELVESPFILGIIKPTVYLPYGLDEENVTCVLAHEKAHIERRDYIIKPAAFILLSMHWFNPFMWVAYILLCRDIEYACDEKVVKYMPKEKRQQYSKAILKNSISRKIIVACPVAFGEVNVKERVKKVINYKKPAFWVIITAIISCAVVAVCFLTNPLDKTHGEDGTSPQIETESGEELITEEQTAEVEMYYDITIEKEVANQIAIEFNLPSGCTLKKENGQSIIMPYAYDKADRSWPGDSRMSTGAIQIITDKSGFKFSDDGKLIGGIPLSNHASYSDMESVAGLVWPAMIVYWDYDLYTITELSELKDKGITPAYTTSQYWTIYFVSQDYNTAFSISLAANKYTKEQAIGVARTVKVVDINAKVTSGKARFNYLEHRYTLNFNGSSYMATGIYKTIGALEDATYRGMIKNINSSSMSLSEIESLGIKKGARIYTKGEYYREDFYIQLGEGDESINFSRK